jgi:RNA polymerase sigma-70 factor (ECF subfamily)
MVAVHMDPRLTGRFDPSDVVQDALIEAHRRLPGYLRKRPMAFYPWLRQLASDRLSQISRQHLRTRKRSVAREARPDVRLPGSSIIELSKKLVARESSPSAQMARNEQRVRVREALLQLSDQDRDILVLRFLEQLSTAEIADVLDITKAAVGMRQLRALQRFERHVRRLEQERRP